MKTHVLTEFKADDVDMSPDEESVAVLTSGDVQVWNFRKNAVVLHARIGVPDSSRRYGRQFVRFNGDGTLLVVYLGDMVLHTLATTDLREVASVNLRSEMGEPSERQWFFLRSIVVAPSQDRVGIIAGVDARLLVLVYGLHSGNRVGKWMLPSSLIDVMDTAFHGGHLAWRSDAQRLVVAGRPGTVYVLEMSSGKILKTFKAGSIGDVAFRESNELITSDGDWTACALFSKEPPLKIYDSTSGKLLRTIPVPGWAVQGELSSSVQGRRLLANVKKWKCHDKLVLPGASLAAREFCVFDLETGTVATQHSSEDLDALRLSARGHYAFGVSTLESHVTVFELPTAVPTS